MSQKETQNSNQQSSTVVAKNSYGQPTLNERNILELIYEDKWQNIKDCLVPNNDYIKQYNDQVTTNKDPLDLITSSEETVGQDLFDQNNRLNWFMPEEYKQFNVEEYVLGLCKTSEETERVNYELNLFKSHAMMDVLQFLKYMVDTLRKNNIVWGVGRGSSVASYVLYLLGVHKVNSIKYNLDPTEFLR